MQTGAFGGRHSSPKFRVRDTDNDKEPARRSKRPPAIFTIGHSTHPIAEFLALLQQVGVDLLVDVRSIPRSRTNPQFNADALSEALGTAGIRYRPLLSLGGRRHRIKGSPA